LTGPADPRKCPYVGLDPFVPAYERFFFGREQESRVVADHVASRPITVLYGPSGVGKSSVLNVGLPAALRRRRRPWMIVTLRDWQDPNTIEETAIDALEAALPAARKIRLKGVRSPLRLVAAVRAAKRPLLLILDQFEEYFLYRSETLLARAEQELGKLLATRKLDVHLLIALRDDSLHLLDKLRAIIPSVLETTVQLGHLDDAAAKRAILGPIQVYNEIYRQGATSIEVEGALVAALVQQLQQGDGRRVGGASPRPLEPIELPYLQLTMTKLWTEEGGREATRLRLQTLTTKLGGVQQIARNHVDGILSELTLKEQSLCAEIFRYLVTAGAGKIAYPTSDLAEQINEYRKRAGESGVDEIVAEKEVKAVLDKLAQPNMRLIKRVTTKGLVAFELFHDVLGTPVLVWRRGFTDNERLRVEQLRADEQNAFASFLKALNQTTDPSARSLTQALPAFAAKLTDARAQAAVETALAAIKRTADPDWLRSLAKALLVLPVKLTDEQAQAAIESILAANEKAANSDAFQWLAQTLSTLASKLTNVQAATEPIIAAIKQSTDPFAFRSLAEALQGLPAKLTDTQAQAAIDSVLGAMHQTTDSESLRSLAQALQALPHKLTDAQVAIESVLAVIRQAADTFALRSLAQALQALPTELTNAQAQAAIESILAAIKQTSLEPLAQPISFEPLAQALSALAPKLTDMQAQAAIESILGAIKQTTDPFALQPLAQALQTLPVILTDTQSQAATESILAAIRKTTNPFVLQPLAQALRALPALLTDGQAQLAIESILAAIKKTGDPYDLQSLAQTSRALAPKLTDGQAQVATESILAVFKQTTNPLALESRAQALQALPAKFTDAQAQAATESIRAAIAQTTTKLQRRSLARASQALVPKLTDLQAPEVRELLRTYLAGDQG
jgi:hypothetical protein